jgi:sec-independent protein translocase protein TatA
MPVFCRTLVESTFYNGSVTRQGDPMVSIGVPALLIFNSPVDILVVLLVFVVLFGGKKIPELAKGLGQGIRNFKGAVKEEEPEEPKEENKQIK